MSDLVKLPPILYFVVFSSKTSFFKLQDVFPECFFYRDDHPQIEPLFCLQEDNGCVVGKNCMEHLSKRIYILFQEVCPNSDLIILYFKKRNYHGLGAGVFWKDFREPRVITMNPTAWARVKERGNIYQFDPSRDFFMSGNAPSPEKVENSEDHLAE